MLLLVDLSNNNAGPIDFRAMRRAGVFGVWLKVSEGAGYADPDFAARADGARSAGLRVGGYHFAHPHRGSAQLEAAHFVGLLGKVRRRDLRPVLDLEKNDGNLPGPDLHYWARHFLAHVHSLAHVRALTYSGPAFIRRQGWRETLGAGAGLWLADYGPNDGRDHPPTIPDPWRRIVAHQFTSRGHVAGVVGEVDLSHARARRRILAYPVRGLL
jgi:GH25 family lysozyme M1 (1,4-beta-N-acetylmuramidase)